MCNAAIVEFFKTSELLKDNLNAIYFFVTNTLFYCVIDRVLPVAVIKSIAVKPRTNVHTNCDSK